MTPSSDARILSWWDRFLISVAPDWGLRRVRAKITAEAMSRHFEAAQIGRRTSNWHRNISDANAAHGTSLRSLRELSRDLRRNNGWAKRGVQAIVNNTVGWGIMPKPDDTNARKAQRGLALWKDWASSTACDFEGRHTFYGLQRLMMETIAESGEALVLLQPASPRDGLPVPLRIHVLEADYLDINRDGVVGDQGGPVIQGVEFDNFGRRVAYWLYQTHPGASRLATAKFVSVRVPAERVLHVFRQDRPGQVRGVPWLAASIAKLKDFDDYEDAELMQQKIAACFGAFVQDVDGASTAIGEQSTDDPGIETLEPGHIEYLPPGKTVTFATPPTVQDGTFTQRQLRRVAAGLGVTYEDLTGDYSQVNFSSARMARLAHWANVSEWRWHMLIPQFCDGVWRWVMDMAADLYGWDGAPAATWAPPPMPLVEPDKEGLAYQRMIRSGLMTWGQAVRELGEDPTEQLDEIKRFNDDMDARGIVLDTDPRKTTTNGIAQQADTGGAQSSDGADGGDGQKALPPGPSK